LTDIVHKLRSSPDDQAAWTEFFRKLYPRVFFMLFRLTRGNRAVAEELAQDAFARFVRYDCLGKVESEESAAAFLRMTARNAYFSHLRQNPAMTSLDGLEERDEPHGDDDSSRLARGIDFDRAFERLGAEDRRLLTWSFEGYSLAEIAERLGTSYSAAALRVHRLRRRLQENARALDEENLPVKKTVKDGSIE
jgi:RNA polymerase sigma factor (sigma-70 family)